MFAELLKMLGDALVKADERQQKLRERVDKVFLFISK